MITRIDWRATWTTVVVVLVLGFVVGLIVNTATTLYLQRASSSATELAMLLGAVGYGLACVLGLIYGVVAGGLYAWLAGRRKPLDTSDAVVGAAVTVALFVVIAAGVNLCWSSTALVLQLQQAGAVLDNQGAATALISILVTTLMRGGIQLVVGLIAGPLTALGTARLTRRG